MHFVIQSNGKVESYPKSTTAEARAEELGGTEKGVFCVGSQKALSVVPTSLLITLYNLAASEPESHAKTITKFSDRATGEKRVWPVVEYLAVAGKAPEKSERTKKERKPRGDGSGRRGRVSQYAGKKIFKIVEGNPRREGTKGFDRYALYTSGMLYETFIEKGGRVKDLAWDVDHKFVEVKAG